MDEVKAIRDLILYLNGLPESMTNKAEHSSIKQIDETIESLKCISFNDFSHVDKVIFQGSMNELARELKKNSKRVSNSSLKSYLEQSGENLSKWLKSQFKSL